MKNLKKLLAVLLTLTLVALASLPARADNGCPVDGCDGVHEAYNAGHAVTLTIHHFVMPKNHTAAPGTGEALDTTGWVPMAGVAYTVTQTLNADRGPVQGTPFTYTGATEPDGSLAVPGALPHGVYKLTAVLPINAEDNAANAEILLELPMTNPDGTGFIYDVHIYPKNALLAETLTITGVCTSGYTAFNGEGVDFAVNAALPVGIGGAAYYVIALPMGDDFADPVLKGLTIQPGGTSLVAADYAAAYISDFSPDSPAAPGTAQPSGSGGTLVVQLTGAGLAKLAAARAAEPTATLRAIYTATLALESGAGKAAAAAGVYYQNAQGFKESAVYADGPAPFVYTGQVQVSKVDGADTDTKLTGASFVLRRATGGGFEYYALNVATGAVTWHANKADATTLTTDATGLIAFTGLADGAYELEETVAPAGYNRMRGAEGVTLEIETKSEVTLTKTIANNQGLPLPLTGGTGTLLLTLGGLFVMLLVLVLAARRRKAAKRR